MFNYIKSNTYEFLQKESIVSDQKEVFPFKSFDEIVKNNLHKMTLNEDYGGMNLGIKEACKFISEISSACSSTGLCLAMHTYMIGGLRTILNSDLKNELFTAVSNGEFMCSISNPNILNKGAKPLSLQAEKVEGGYIVNGTKRYVSGIERFHFLPIYVTDSEINSNYSITALMANKKLRGVEVTDTWNYSGMLSSKTQNIVFNNVFIPDKYLIGARGYGIEDTTILIYWFRLLLSAVYWGIAVAAFNHINKVFKDDINSFNKNKTHQFKFSEMKINLETVKNQILSCASNIEEAIDKNTIIDELYSQSLITQIYTTTKSIEIVNLALEMQGMSSYNRGTILEKLYRDVRAGTFHPPSEDIIRKTISYKQLGIINRDII